MTDFTVNRIGMTQFQDIAPMIDAVQTWEDGVSLGISLREDRDRASWALGVLADKMCSGRVGRPQDERTAEDLTITKFANDIGEQREVISALLANFRHYQHIDAEAIPAELSWRQLSEARRRSGARAGQAPTPEQVEHTVNFLHAMADKPHPPISPIVAYLNALERAARDVRRLIQAAEKAGIVSFRLSELAMEIEKLQQAADKVKA